MWYFKIVRNGIIPYFVYDISKFIDCDLVNRKKKNPKSIDNVD